jgi:hypothetical protein
MCPGFPSPFGHRHSLLGHPIPAGGLGLPHGRLTDLAQGRARTPTGLPRSAHTSCDRGGCPLNPEDGGAHPGRVASPTSACRSTAASPFIPLQQPIHGTLLHEASTRVQAIHPTGLPLACGPRMERAPSGFPPSFAPRRPKPDDARRGGDRPPSTDLKQRSKTSAEPPSCVFTHGVRPRVARRRAGASRRAG